MALFAPVLQGDFVYDDRSLISLNPTMQDWSVIGKSFTTPYWELVDQSRFGSGFYRPLGAATLGTLWQLGSGSPWAFHLTSLLLHAACAAAVASLGLALGWRKSAAAAAGILFAVHGSHAEPVAWISGIPELLATLFCLLGLRGLALGQPLRTALWLLAAMLCKEVAIGVWLLALAITLLRPGSKTTTPTAPSKASKAATQQAAPQVAGGELGEKKFPRWPTFFTLSAAALAVYALRVFAFDSAAAGFDRVNTFHGLEQSEQITLSFSLIGRYLAFLVWPWPHMPFRPLGLTDAASATRLWIGVVGGLVSLVALGVWLRHRKNTTLLFALGLLFAGLIPVMNTQALGQYPFEERFLYLPSAGFALLMVVLIQRLPKQSWAWAAMALLVVPHAYSAHAGSKHWKSEEALFGWARTIEPNAVTGHIEYGRLMLENAQNAADDLQRNRFTDYALNAYQESLAVDPDLYFVTSVEREKGNLGLGDALYLEQDFAGAEAVYRRTVDHYKFSPIGYLGLANCRAQIAIGHGQTGHVELASSVMAEALILFETALQQDEHLESAILGKASALLSLGRNEEALESFERALLVNPGLEAALFGKANTLVSLGLLDQAQNFATGIFSQQPANLEAALLLLDVQMQMNRVDLAIRTLDYFLEQAPGHPQRDMVLQTVEELRRMQSNEPLGPPR
jgi:tetratricopeptide (TPR) repeat protein